MLTPTEKTNLKKFFNHLQDRPLDPKDPFYVPFLEKAYKEGDPISQIATRITWSDAASVSLLSGQRGSGKSTELQRLKQMLEEEGCVVFLCDMLQHLNMTKPLEISDFFISVMGALSVRMEEDFSINPADLKYWDRLVNFLQTEVNFESIKANVGTDIAKVEITASLRDDPTFKQQLQQKLRGHVANMVKQAHDFSTEVVDIVRKKTGDPDKKVVLLVDSVEQLRGVGPEEESRKVYESIENLFSGHADKLHLPLLHVLYTVPPYLSTLAPGTGRYLGGGPVFSLPSIRIRKRNLEKDEDGLGTMREIIEKRYADWQNIFTKETLDRLALSSGGDLRDFFRLIRDCLISVSTDPGQTLPVQDHIIASAENHLRRNMLPIPEEDIEWLKRISISNSASLEKSEQLQRLAHFFDSNLVLNYRNGDDWYNIHPLLEKVIEETSGKADHS